MPTNQDLKLWRYNATDCILTLEIAEALTARSAGSEAQVSFLQSMFYPTFYAMNRGILINESYRTQVSKNLATAAEERLNRIAAAVGHTLNPRSPKQLSTFFYDDLGIKAVKKRGTGALSTDDEALNVIASRQPIVWPIVKWIQEFRSIGLFKKNFIDAKLGPGGRMYPSLNIAGTETLRMSSSKNAFKESCNMQTLPKGGKSGDFDLPNVRTMFVPDKGMTMFDIDLSRADLYCVAADANEPNLMSALKAGADIHLANAFAISGKTIPPLEELVESHPSYGEHKKAVGALRQDAKKFAHACDYGAGDKILATNLAKPVSTVAAYRAGYFARYPGIQRWQRHVEQQLQTKHFITNPWGYRRTYYERADGVLPQALAWLGSSPVSVYINKLWLEIYNQLPWVEVLLQVHDSLVGQFPTSRLEEAKESIHAIARGIAIPYSTPLVIPIGFKHSDRSWGDCE